MRPLSEIMSVQEPAPSIPEPPTITTFPPSEESPHDELPTPIPITITPASPGVLPPQYNGDVNSAQFEKPTPLEKRSNSLDEKTDISRGQKVKQVLKTRVHKGQATFNTISKKIGHGVGRRASLNLKRNVSTPGTVQQNQSLPVTVLIASQTSTLSSAMLRPRLPQYIYDDIRVFRLHNKI